MANSDRLETTVVARGRAASRRAAAEVDTSLGIAGAAATNAGSAANDSTFEGIANKVDTGVSYAWNIPIVGGVGATLIKWGEKENAGRLGTLAKWLGQVLNAPQKFLEKHTLGKVTKIFTKDSAEVAGLAGAQPSWDAAESPANGVTGSEPRPKAPTMEQRLAAVGANADEYIKGNDRLNRLRTSHVAKLNHKSRLARAAAQQAHAAAGQHLADAKTALQGDKFAGVRKVIDAARADLGKNLKPPEDPAATKRVAEAMAEHQKAFDEAMAAAGQGNRGMFSFLRRKPPAEKAYANFAKQVLESHSHTARAEALASKADFRGELGHLKKGLASIPGKILEMKGSEALNHGIYWGSQGTSAYRAIHGFTGGMSELKNIYAHEKGIHAKDVSAFKILMGNDLPPSMQQARREYLKANTIKAVGNVVGMFAFHHAIKGGKNQKYGFIAQMAATAGGQLLAGKTTVDAGEAIDKALARGQEVPKGAYLALLAFASPKVRNMDESDANLMRVADQYARQKLSAGAVMNEIDSGAFDRRLAAAAPAANDASFEQQNADDTLLNARKAKEPQKPIGKFTEGEAVRRIVANGDAQRTQI